MPPGIAMILRQGSRKPRPASVRRPTQAGSPANRRSDQAILRSGSRRRRVRLQRDPAGVSRRKRTLLPHGFIRQFRAASGRAYDPCKRRTRPKPGYCSAVGCGEVRTAAAGERSGVAGCSLAAGEAETQQAQAQQTHRGGFRHAADGGIAGFDQIQICVQARGGGIQRHTNGIR